MNNYERFVECGKWRHTADAPVGKRRDDESLGTAEELVLILEVDVSDADETLVDVIEEVEPRLLRPLKVRRRLDRQLALKRNVLVFKDMQIYTCDDARVALKSRA